VTTTDQPRHGWVRTVHASEKGEVLGKTRLIWVSSPKQNSRSVPAKMPISVKFTHQNAFIFLPFPPFFLSCFPAEKHHGNSVGLALLYRIRIFCPLHTISTKSARGKRVWEHFHSSGIRYARAMLRAGIVRIGEEQAYGMVAPFLSLSLSPSRLFWSG